MKQLFSIVLLLISTHITKTQVDTNFVTTVLSLTENSFELNLVKHLRIKCLILKIKYRKVFSTVLL
jgi:hypothetical protein